ncbi:MAG: MerR family transcriptional regulator [Tannerella sp.]|jgi:DNA-binding transcriptional MerR regulator|nr:MerR family transcriptional regulator [Tannerella sp.]
MNNKIQYSIKEVAAKLNENESTVRFWEGPFPDFIAPYRNDTGHRFYTDEDIDKLKMVRYLLRDVGLKIEGAQKRLKDNPDSAMSHSKAIDKLKHVKSELKALQAALNTVMPTS